MTHLIDANILMALADANHPHRARCDAWFTTIDHFATCPITEGALARATVRGGQPVQNAARWLRRATALPGYEFWPDSIPYLRADLSQVRGYRQVTDAYLVSLVRSHPGSKLATLDEGLAQLYPEDVLLVPELPASA